LVIAYKSYPELFCSISSALGNDMITPYKSISYYCIWVVV